MMSFFTGRGEDRFGLGMVYIKCLDPSSQEIRVEYKDVDKALRIPDTVIPSRRHRSGEEL
jgi:hypothetical protein